MTQETWTAVDEYINATLIGADEILEAAGSASDDAGLPSIQVSPAQGRLLNILARLLNARRILEIGTLGGYSTIWLARALPPDGALVTMEIDPRHAAVAQSNVRRAGLADRVEILTGNALDLLPELERRNDAPFDLFFIDADKASIPAYFASALRMSRAGSLILVDNVVRGGAVIDAASEDRSVQGVRRLNEMIAAESRVSATVIQTVGIKGYDGVTLAIVNDNR
ncbi:MAG: O-methyltransferase [Gemmatimonadaceae bacterium]